MFALTDEQRHLGEAARAFAEAELNADLVERDRRGTHVPAEWRRLWKACADHGLLGLAIPKADGGAGHDIVTTVHVLHEVGHGCRDNGLTLALNAQVWTVLMPILEFGTAAQKARYLAPVMAGDWIGADAVTEPSSGSDAMAMETRAERDGDHYVLNGRKALIGMAPDCDFALVFAKTAPDAGAWGVSAFLVDAGTPGFQRGPEVEKTGLRTIPTGFLGFADCRVPASARLGREGAGSAIFARSAEWERQLIFASHVGRMRRQLDDCIAFARERRAFGKPIDQHQSVANRLADMRVRHEAARQMLMRAAWQMQGGTSDTLQAAVTKLFISEAFLASSTDAVRIMGGQGCLFEADVARDQRDALAGVIYGGTSDIQRHIIAQVQGRKSGS